MVPASLLRSTSLAASSRGRVLRRAVGLNTDAVPAGGLGEVEGFVGAPHGVGDGGIAGADGADADARRDAQRVLADLDRQLLDLQPQLLGRDPSPRGVRAGQQADEFLSPDARQRIAGAQHMEADHRDLAEHLVSGRVAVLVVDDLEMIEVDLEEAIYQSEPGHFSWYGDEGGNTALGYQQNPYSQYLEQLQRDIDRLMEE